MSGSDRDAEFSQFVAGHGGRLVRSATLLCGDPQRAEDLVQTALERAYLRWHRITDADPYGYVYRSVVNGNRDWWRRSRGRERSTAAPPEVASSDQTATVDERDALIRALAALTRRERAVLVLRYFEDRSEADIAGLLQIAPGTVKSTASRGLAKLRADPLLSADRPNLIEENR